MVAPYVIEMPKANGLSFYLRRHTFRRTHLFYLVPHNLYASSLIDHLHNLAARCIRVCRVVPPVRYFPSGPPFASMKRLNVILELGIQICVLSVIL